MGIKINASFDVMSPVPLDSRTVLSKAEMLAIDDNCMPDTYFAVCSDDNSMYIYTKLNVSNDDTGKFRKMTSDGSGEIELNDVYTKGEVNNLIDDTKSEITTLIDDNKTEVNTLIDDTKSEITTLIEDVKYRGPVSPESTTKISLDSTIDSSIYKKGESISDAMFSLNITKGIPDITKIELYINNALVKDDFEINTNELENSYSVDYTHAEVINSDMEFEFRVYDTVEINYAKFEVSFVSPSYYGAVESIDDLTTPETMLTEILLKDRSFDWKNITETNKLFCYAYPASMGELSSIVDENNFNMTYFFNSTDIVIGDVDYKLYYTSSTASLKSGRLIFN